MVGALADGAEIRMPAHPANPMAVASEAPITSTVTSAPAADRSRRPIARTMPRYISGTRVCMSRIVTSAKVWSIITAPVR